MQHIADSKSVPAAPIDTLSTRLVIRVDRGIYRFSGHWLFTFNTISCAVILAAVLAPVFRAAEWNRLADSIYRAFSGFCHQDPDRSFQIAGHSIACCERCTAIYGSLALFGLLFALVRTSLRKPTYVEMVLLISPVVLDGMAVGADIYDGNVVVRIITGSLFGLGLIWFLYPRFESGFSTMRIRIEALFDKLVAQGRAQPL